MQFDHYLQRWQSFVDLHDISTEELPRRNKHLVEVIEYLEAVFHGTKEQADDEVLDVVITAIALAQSRGIHDILHACAMKLEWSTEKYIKQGGYNGATATDKK